MRKLLVLLVLINPFVWKIFAQSHAIKKLEQQTFEEVNKYRVEKRLPALVWNDTVYVECAKHTKNMAQGRIPLSHEGGKERFDILNKKIKAMSFAENVAMGQTTAEQVTNSWVNSTGHRKNIEGKYTTTAVAIVADKDGRYWFTQIFIAK